MKEYHPVKNDHRKQKWLLLTGALSVLILCAASFFMQETGKALALAPSTQNDLSPGMTPGWIEDEKGWRYLEEDGSFVRSDWKKTESGWYHFDDTGYMQTGWFTEGSARYYLKPSGAMATGWVKVDENWYYMGGSGAMRTGWQWDGDKWYYMQPDGVMAKGHIRLGNTRYYMDAKGALYTGWLQEEGFWYYLKPPYGAMCVDETCEIEGKTYHFDSEGHRSVL